MLLRYRKQAMVDVGAFGRHLNEIFAVLGSHAAWIGNYRRFGTTCLSHRQR